MMRPTVKPMTDRAFATHWDDGTDGTVDPPPRASERAGERGRMTPQVRPIRPTRPAFSFPEQNQINKWDGQPVRSGTALKGGA